jgi:hypothetical protein
MADKEIAEVVKEPTDEEYFSDLLQNDDDLKKVPTPPSEEQLRKNKDAEEARKRREAEAKQKKEAEAKPVEQPEVAKKPAEPVVQPESVKPAEDPKAQQVNKLGEQLVQFKQKFPDVDLAQLDQDKSFKRFIDGKLLGKKDFSTLYQEYQEFKNEMLGVQQANNNAVKSQASTGSSVSTANVGNDVYSEDELRRISEKLPFMSPREAAKVESKLKRSIQFYDNKK